MYTVVIMMSKTGVYSRWGSAGGAGGFLNSNSASGMVFIIGLS